MNKNIFMYLSVALILLIPFPGRFAYGLVAVIQLNILLISGLAFRELLVRLKMEELQSQLICILLIFLSILFKLILTAVSPVMALTAGYAMYMPAVSVFVLTQLFDKQTVPLIVCIQRTMKKSLSVSLVMLAIFLVRDLIGYGTVTFPSSSGLAAVKIIPWAAESSSVGVFVASIPAALIIIGLLLILFSIVQTHRSLKNIPVQASKENTDADVE
ncbi:MAG: hypothetical protein J5930_08150 [Treponema sp.]|nr:hypothetical protein [Treponema sp.]